jgi:hypothetical protein
LRPRGRRRQPRLASSDVARRRLLPVCHPRILSPAGAHSWSGPPGPLRARFPRTGSVVHSSSRTAERP